MTRFRCSNHHLAIETGWTSVERCDRICKYCFENCNVIQVEDEFNLIGSTQLIDLHIGTFCKLVSAPEYIMLTGLFVTKTKNN